MVCPKCGCSNVFVQQVDEGSIGASRTIAAKRTHGLFYWVFIGSWIWIFKLVFFPFRLLFGHTKRKTVGRTISGSKILHSTKATCQGCGYCWKV